ncbi:MAG: hypothetical protein JXA97_04160 [Anaerolineales bacterium]|nr:hypothetical protein [Anaerolineales bacterium]
MSSIFLIGLRISVIGLGITFLALAFLLLLMRLLLRVFPPAREEPGPSAALPAETDGDCHEEMAVALAVGICLLERSGSFRRRDLSLGRLLEQ